VDDLPRFVRFSDLVASGIVNSWQTLSKWRETHGFPTGRLIAPNTRVWTPEEIEAWLDTRPTAAKPVKLTDKHVSRRGKQAVAKPVADPQVSPRITRAPRSKRAIR
jgi:hypothetical protein